MLGKYGVRKKNKLLAPFQILQRYEELIHSQKNSKG
jgi:hypothetical protein